MRQPAFTYSACGLFTKNKGKRETRDSRHIYQNEVKKACFHHNMAYGAFKDLLRRTASYKGLRDKVFNIAKNPKYDEYQRDLASLVYNFFDKKVFWWRC